MVQIAFSNLSYSELEAISEILKALPGWQKRMHNSVTSGCDQMASPGVVCQRCVNSCEFWKRNPTDTEGHVRLDADEYPADEQEHHKIKYVQETEVQCSRGTLAPVLRKGFASMLGMDATILFGFRPCF